MAVWIADLGLSSILAMFVLVIMFVAFEFDPDPEYQDSKQYTKWFLSALCGIIKAVSNKCLKCMRLCPCCYKESCPNLCRECWGLVGQMVGCTWTCLLFLLLVFTIMLALYWGVFDDFAGSFITNQMTGWCTSYLMMKCAFNRKWKKEKMNKGGRLSKFKVTYMEYDEYRRETSTVGAEHKEDSLLDGAGAVTAVPQNRLDQVPTISPLPAVATSRTTEMTTVIVIQ